MPVSAHTSCLEPAGAAEKGVELTTVGGSRFYGIWVGRGRQVRGIMGLPGIASIRTEICADLLSNPAHRNGCDSQHVRVRKTGRNSSDHHGIEYTARLRPCAAIVSAGKHAVMSTQVNYSWSSTKGYRVQVSMRIR